MRKAPQKRWNEKSRRIRIKYRERGGPWAPRLHSVGDVAFHHARPGGTRTKWSRGTGATIRWIVRWWTAGNQGMSLQMSPSPSPALPSCGSERAGHNTASPERRFCPLTTRGFFTDSSGGNSFCTLNKPGLHYTQLNARVASRYARQTVPPPYVYTALPPRGAFFFSAFYVGCALFSRGEKHFAQFFVVGFFEGVHGWFWGCVWNLYKLILHLVECWLIFGSRRDSDVRTFRRNRIEIVKKFWKLRKYSKSNFLTRHWIAFFFKILWSLQGSKINFRNWVFHFLLGYYCTFFSIGVK